MFSILCTLAFITCIPPPPVVVQRAIITAYTASQSETDETPCLTASGLNICESNEVIVANNCLPFGTIIQIDGAGYSVQDRMNRRYDCDHFDILMANKGQAKKFGRQIKLVSIFN